MNSTFPEGLYLGKIRASDGAMELAITDFTIHIAPQNMAGKHPRLLFDAEKKKQLDVKIRQPKFSKVYDDILKKARAQREKIPVNTLIF